MLPLAAGENVQALLTVDLDADLRFCDDLLVLTDRRVLFREQHGTAREWPLATPGLALQLVDHAGVGTLDLVSDAGRLARWRYTLAGQPAALQMARRLARLCAGTRAGSPPEFAEVAQTGIQQAVQDASDAPDTLTGDDAADDAAPAAYAPNRRRHRPGCCCASAASRGPTGSS